MRYCNRLLYCFFLILLFAGKASGQVTWFYYASPATQFAVDKAGPFAYQTSLTTAGSAACVPILSSRSVYQNWGGFTYKSVGGAYCYFDYVASNGSNYYNSSLQVTSKHCLDGQTVQRDPTNLNSIICVDDEPAPCEDFPSEFSSIVGSSAITGFFPVTAGASGSPVTAEEVCYDTGSAECHFDVSDIVPIYQYSDGGSLLGYNATLSATTTECGDTDRYYVQSWDAPRDPPSVAYCQDPANASLFDCIQIDENPGGEEQPEIVAGDPGTTTVSLPSIDDPTDIDSSTVTDSTALNQAVVAELQEVAKQVRTGNVISDNIEKQIDQSNDLLATIANRLGNNENDAKLIVDPKDCAAPATCAGDPIACAIFNETRAQRCLAQNQAMAPTELELIAAIDSIQPQSEVDAFLEGETLDVAGMIDDTAKFSGSCPAPFNLTLMGASVLVKVDSFCEFAETIKPMLLLIAYMVASFIVFRSL